MLVLLQVHLHSRTRRVAKSPPPPKCGALIIAPKVVMHVVPAKAGIHLWCGLVVVPSMDPRLRGATTRGYGLKLGVCSLACG